MVQLQSSHNRGLSRTFLIGQKSEAVSINEESKKKETKLSIKDKIIKQFKEKGFNSQDVPKAIIIHELLGVFMLVLTWSLCYYVQINQLAILQQPLAKLTSYMPKIVTTNELITSRLGVAYMESSCLRKIIRPVTFPAKLIVTMKLVQMTKPSLAGKKCADCSCNSSRIPSPSGSLKQISSSLPSMEDWQTAVLC